MSLTLQSIALNKLSLWKGNVRKTSPNVEIEELAASIASHGLLNPLLVREEKRGQFAVVAGQRRLLALQRLAATDRIDSDAAIECRVANEEASAAELSLAENVVRLAMHPADEFEAFRDLVEAGSDLTSIAHRFGVSEQRVEKRLRLGRLSPVILAAYRAGDLGLEDAMAFTLGADHETQERVFKDLPPWQCKPCSIRRALTPGEIPASDPRVQLVGLEAYAQAGGVVRRDLFDDENEGYVQDEVLLDSLTFQRLKEEALAVEAEGWAWVECALTLDYAALSRFSRVYPERGLLPPDQQAELETLQALCDELAGDDSDEAQDRRDASLARIEELEDAAETYTPEQRASAGAVLSVGYSGEVEIRRGLVRPSDAKSQKAADEEQASAAPAEKPLSNALLTELSAQKTAALAATLMKRPDIALAASVHALALEVFFPSGGDTCLRLQLTRPDLEKNLFAIERCKAAKAISAEEKRWRKRLPHAADELFAWCLAQTKETLLDLLAYVTALSVDTVQDKYLAPERAAPSAALAEACALDLAQWYRPSADTYFARVPRTAILLAIKEATGNEPAPAWSKLKRDELAKKAAKLIAGTSWLPVPLRPAQAPDAS